MLTCTCRHANDIVHRDVKSANILIGVDGQLKLADFGASKYLGEMRSGGDPQSIAGTPYWMAPEVVLQSKYDAKADIWSVGCVVVEMLTGKHPYAELNQFAAIYQISQGARPTYREDRLSPQLRHFMLQCFQQDPAQRPTAGALLQHPFLAARAPASLQ